MFNLALFAASITPMVVIFFTYVLVVKYKTIGIALRKLDTFLRLQRLTYVYAAFGPHLLISHFTVLIGMNEHTLIMFIGAILTLLGVAFIEDGIIFALASVGPLLLLKYFTVDIGINAGTGLMLLGIIFTGIALIVMKKRPEL